jgi:multicomponent Na+:H+ antiporter subunit D
LAEVSDSRTVFTAYAFFVVGVCLKLALFPLHLWLPDAYAYAPSAVTAFLAATATKVPVYILIRFVFSVFGVEFSFSYFPLQDIFLVLSLTGILVASMAAFVQHNVKRLLAYSSIAQIGYMILGFSMGNPAGLMATLLHLFNHALIKGALFLAVGAVMYRVGGVRLSDFAGLGRLMPWTLSAIVISCLSLIGAPLTVGFVSKWYLVAAALERGWWPVAALTLVGSLLTVIYVWRIVEAAYFKAPTSDNHEVSEAPLSLLLPVWMLVIANIYFGLDTRLTIGTSELIAKTVFGVVP